MLQFEESAKVCATGLEHLIGAFPDDDGCFCLSGYSAGGVCLFLSMQPDTLTLPGQREVAAFFHRIIDRLEAGAVVFPMELSAAERKLIRRLGAVFVEVVIDGQWRGFPLLISSGEAAESPEVWVSQGLCDLVLGRWELWGADRPLEPADDAMAWFPEAAPRAVA